MSGTRDALDEIINLQRWTATLTPKEHPLVQELVTHLSRARSCLETILVKQKE